MVVFGVFFTAKSNATCAARKIKVFYKANNIRIVEPSNLLIMGNLTHYENEKNCYM